MNYAVKKSEDYTFIDEGSGEILLLLHGLFGALSNWDHVINHFTPKYRVIIPVLPITEIAIKNASINGLVDFLEGFIANQNLDTFNLLGNSLGGHIGVIYVLRNQHKVIRLVLTGSSGLFEDTMGGSFPKRGSYEYVKERIGYTFYDPSTATDDLINEVFETTKSIGKCLRIVSIAKSAQRQNLATELHVIKVPTLLVWGLNDTITPPHTAYEFNRLIKGSTLRFIDKCCHAPMMERPEAFNHYLQHFLETN